MNEIQLFKNKELDLQVRTILNEDGSISVNAEDTAIGFGWSRTELKNGKEYMSIMWARMNEYCKELGFAHECAKDDYIPESLFYMLGFKAGNERALKYQRWIAMEVLPSLRKTGSYEMMNKKLQQREISFKEQVESIATVADMLHVNDAGKITMLDKLYKSYQLPTDFLPQYELNGNRELKSLTALIKHYGYKTTPMKLNKLFLQAGILEEHSRDTSNRKKHPNGKKSFKVLTEKGKTYGENAINPKNNQETQPLYYVDTFEELYHFIMQEVL